MKMYRKKFDKPLAGVLIFCFNVKIRINIVFKGFSQVLFLHIYKERGDIGF